jgi:hypothetical protein
MNKNEFLSLCTDPIQFQFLSKEYDLYLFNHCMEDPYSGSPVGPIIHGSKIYAPEILLELIDKLLPLQDLSYQKICEAFPSIVAGN